MDERFREHVEALIPKLATLRDMPPVTVPTLPRVMPARGVYLFSEGDEHLYVGRTNTLRKRLQNHCRPGSTHFQATFAFRLAREATGKLRAAYKAAGSRTALLLDSAFAQAFLDAKARVRQMSVRFVEETKAIRQCLLEVYVAVVLEARYNDFDNH
jgi:predicted GIY-YIG superfamily endonuclease